MTRLFLSVHKWVGIALGVLLFIWLVSGIVMIWPMKLIAPPVANRLTDVRDVTLSPAQAGALVATREGDTAALREFTLVIINGQAHYRLALKSGKYYLLNASTGERLTVDRDQAAAMALAGLPAPLPVAGVEEVRRHNFAYPRGPLPVWRVNFGDPKHTVAWVAPPDGSIAYSTGGHRVRYFIAALHTFDQIKTMGFSKATQHWVLGLTSAVAVLLVFTGYYLVLPRQWRRRWERRGTGAA